MNASINIQAPNNIPNIGNVSFSNRVFLAPMAGYTDPVYRAICRRFGVALTYTEFISCEGLQRRKADDDPSIQAEPADNPYAVQIFGGRIEPVKFAIDLILRKSNPAIIDINMGCSVPKIVRSGAGAALLKDPDKVRELIRTVVKLSDRPVTIKTRAGWDNSTLNYLEVARIAEGEGASAICLHPRTRSDRFDGKPDWSRIGEVKQIVKIPVIGNGDIQTPQDAERMLAETGCDFVMIGRSALGNPWLLKEMVEYLAGNPICKKPSVQERLAMILEHTRRSVSYRDNETLTVRELRKFYTRYATDFAGARELRNSLIQADNLATIEQLCRAKELEKVQNE